MNYQEAMEYIHALTAFGDKLGLERIDELLNRLGDPHKKLKYIHIAGTNGKGSTTATCAGILKEAGYKTGMYISPFVLEFRERMQINGEMIGREELADYVERVKVHADQMAQQDNCPKEFEFITALAFLWFYEKQCDVVCLEVGLGGRFDATNVIESPLVSVIMSISLDHTTILGNDIAKIAFEKCGIIKDTRPVVTYPLQDETALAVIMEQCSIHQSRLILPGLPSVKVLSETVKGTEIIYKDMKIHIPLPGSHQIANCLCAIEAVLVLRQEGYSISSEQIIDGIGKVRFPARFEIICTEPLIVLDGAHNYSGAQQLLKALSLLQGRPITAIAGILSDKDHEGVIGLIAPKCTSIITVTPPNPRALSADSLKEEALHYCSDVISSGDYRQAVLLAREKAGEEGAILVFGSLYLASAIRPILLEFADCQQ